MNQLARLRTLIALSLLALLLAGCDNSALVTFDAPPSVAPQATFPATVNHEWRNPVTLSPADEEDELVFALALPAGWDVGNTVSYSGTVGGNPVNLTLQRQAVEITDNFRDFLLDEGGGQGDVDEYDQFSCSGPGPFAQYVLFRATTPFANGQVALPEGGTFSFDLTAGAQLGGFTLTAAHGLYASIDNPQGQFDPLTSCQFFLDDAPGDPPPVNIASTQITLAGAPPAPAPAVPVPVNAVWLVALMALGLMGTGFWFGRRRRDDGLS